jgi:hypothetical protein
MAEKTAKTRLLPWSMTAAQWTAQNPVLRVGEMVVERDTGKMKLGTGATWSATAYMAVGPKGDTGAIGATGPTGPAGTTGATGADAANTTLTLTDAAASDALPATASTAISTLLQTIRNNLKRLFGYFTSGAANSAVKLQTARTIGLSGGAAGTATSFNGTASISIPVTAVNAAVIVRPTGGISASRTVGVDLIGGTIVITGATAQVTLTFDKAVGYPSGGDLCILNFDSRALKLVFTGGGGVCFLTGYALSTSIPANGGVLLSHAFDNYWAIFSSAIPPA